MIIINSISDNVFSLNGINFAKIYQPLAQGSEAIGIYSIFDTKQQLQNSTDFSEFEIDGSAYASQALTIAALLDVVYTQLSETDFEALEARVVINEADITNLQENQVTGVEVYSTLADLPVTGTLLISYKVSNDSTSSNNGFYHWDGSAYVKDADIMLDNAILANNLDANGFKVVSLEKGINQEDSVNLLQVNEIFQTPSYYNGVDSKVISLLAQTDKGSFEAVFNVIKDDGTIQTILGSSSYGTPWFAYDSASSLFYAKCGTTYFYLTPDTAFINKKYHVLIEWDTGTFKLTLDGIELKNGAYAGTASSSRLAIGSSAGTNYFGGAIYWYIVKDAADSIIYQGSGIDVDDADKVNVEIYRPEYIGTIRNENFEYLTIVRNSDGIVESGIVFWSDGSEGVLTFGDYNSEFYAFDSYTITHIVSGLTATQAAVTRDEYGNVTVKPKIVIT